METQIDALNEIKALKFIPDFNESAVKIIELLNNSMNLLLVTHTNPDGDAIGSCLALLHYLKQKNKNTTLILQSPIPTNLRFLNGIEKVKFINNQNNYKIPQEIDTIVVLDLNDISRLKVLHEEILKSKAKKVVIDHHQEPKDFADFYLIDTTASSTGEILFKLLRQDKNIKWTLEICENLYVAIMTDTGNFRFERTDGEVHRIVAELIDTGVDPVRLYNEVYNKLPFNAAKLMGLGYSKLESYFNGKLVIMPIKHQDFVQTNSCEEDTEGFVESLLSIDGVIMSILIMEIIERNEIRVSIRSKGNYSARALALNFGGGGHINAAGCRFPNADLEGTKQKLIEKAREILV